MAWRWLFFGAAVSGFVGVEPLEERPADLEGESLEELPADFEGESVSTLVLMAP